VERRFSIAAILLSLRVSRLFRFMEITEVGGRFYSGSVGSGSGDLLFECEKGPVASRSSMMPFLGSPAEHTIL
jgi:hypothetical protein